MDIKSFSHSFYTESSPRPHSLLAAVGRSEDFPGGGHCGNQSQTLPIPVPTQLQNYQRLEQNLHSARQDGSPRCVPTNTRTSDRDRSDSSTFCPQAGDTSAPLQQWELAGLRSRRAFTSARAGSGRRRPQAFGGRSQTLPAPPSR